VNFAITGFGRIGRLITRAYFSNPSLRNRIKLVAINDLGPADQMSHLLKFDSVHGRFPYSVSADAESITIDGQRIRLTKYAKPEEIPWTNLGVDLVMECTGRFVDREGAGLHLKAGAKKVMISAPAKSPDGTFVMGVNHTQYKAQEHHIVSNASCTTNCLAPVAAVLNKNFGIKHGLMTTIHSYTSDQRIIDNSHKDLRRGRTAALNMIPTTTGAAKAVGEVIPDLKGKLDGLAVRVPTANVSFTDLVVELQKSVTRDTVNGALKAAAESELKGILEFSTLPLVSSDFMSSTLSSIVDAELTHVIGGDSKGAGTMVKVCAWYDNEFGFSNRMLDFAAYMAQAR
jgi:glyceraldehyde-3-phosphate dehydrogenase type I